MARIAPKNSKAAPQRSRMTPIVPWLLFGGITLLGALLRFARIDEAPGGFLVFNENFYLQLALREQSRNPFAWFYSPLDLNNPPLYTAVVSTILRFHGPLVASARIVSVLAGVAMIIFTFLLGRLLFDQRTGMVAAAAIAVMPGVALVNHNIQVDSLFVALMLAGVFFYLRSAQASLADAIVGGVLLGLAVLTKQPALLALLALAIWRTWQDRGLAWVREPRSWVFAATTAVVGLSWYALQLAIAPQRLLGSAVSVANRPEMLTIDSGFWIYSLGSQLMWMVFPLAAAVAVVGAVVMARKHTDSDIFVFAFFGVYLVYYIGFHLHSYYLLPLAPFVALAIGRACMGSFEGRGSAMPIRTAGVAILIAAMAFGSVMTLSGQKWGRWSPMDFRPVPDFGFASVHLYYDPVLDGYFASVRDAVPKEYSPTPATVDQFVASPSAPGVQDLFLSVVRVTEQGDAVSARDNLGETWVRPVIFGWAIGQRWNSPSALEAFANAPWTAEYVGPWWRFGTLSTVEVAPYSVYTKP